MSLRRSISSGKRCLRAHGGRVVTKGPTIFTGYFRSTEENKKIFTKDGFFKTGDLARIDEEGTITITGRIKETILGVAKR